MGGYNLTNNSMSILVLGSLITLIISLQIKITIFKLYNFDTFFRDSDSEDDGKQSFNLSEKLSSKKFPEYRQYFVKDLKGEEVNLAYFQRFVF